MRRRRHAHTVVHAAGIMRIALFLPRALLGAVALAVSFAAGATEPAASGAFLVASRDMPDPRFRETVVLVTQPQQGGPFGVVINRPLGRRLAEILPEYGALKARRDVIYYGGPVAPARLLFLVRSTAPVTGATRLLADAWLLNDPDAVAELLKRPESVPRWRVYSGYAGWAPGQLQHELARGGWHMLPADAETVFDKDATTIWPELSARTGARRTSLVRDER